MGGRGDQLAHALLESLLRMEERENAYIHGLCLANEGVGTVLDLVLGSSAELLSDLGPLVAHLSLVLSKEFVFLISPGEMGDGGIEVVVPSRRVEESEGARTSLCTAFHYVQGWIWQ